MTWTRTTQHTYDTDGGHIYYYPGLDWTLQVAGGSYGGYVSAESAMADFPRLAAETAVILEERY